MTGEGSHDFARVRRIVKTDEFSSVFRLRPAQKTAHFVLYTRPNALPHARLGVVAAKRFAPRAVTRNTIKRVTRELFRTTPLPGIDCIVRLARPVNTKTGPATNTALKTLLHAELAKLFASQAPRTRKPAPPSNTGNATAAAAEPAAAATPPGSGPRPS
ncbi:ribonuclease P protein component [Herbaspirillum sp. SJZ107]|uniref:ribonuclease P protein component n=1 Tax=Herbaspirillum sp. SJZ107 TaxID=2572881 RepID=UPI0011522D3D|nr:ribonuclease P protein component [Herbaspirillum sp. SJZ107]TQK05650.1 ribonuclease P protein component [Herbaspirillum sp. SJZ107]